MRKSLLLLLAIAVFALYNYGLIRWIHSGHTFDDVWQGITNDWLLAITFFDMGLFSLLCLVWLYRDMRQRNMAAGKRFLILFTTLIAGVVVLLAYLAFRKNDGTQP